jgi:methylase of polypeptide subunit release factors
MSGDATQAKEAIRRCRELRNSGKVEAVLRSEFLSRLRLIFPSSADEAWINHYSSGAEAHTKIGKADGKIAARFIDNLIGSTTIEYEADLRNKSKRKEGFRQVKEHAAGLVRSGIPVSQVRCVLSDTIDWYVYDVALATGVSPDACSVDDIEVSPVDELQILDDEDSTANRLISLLRKHLAREQSRPLTAELLTADLGLDGSLYQRSIDPLTKLVVDGRAKDSSILLATDLWSRFVDHLERAEGKFRADAYVDEMYLCVLSRLLSANVLADQAISSDDIELKAILDGSYFRARYQLSNMVELDYFGWLTSGKHINKFVPTAREIQRDLYAYDFAVRPEEDLFGRLMAQLARRSQRKLLGQEWTPTWLARLLANRCIDNLPKGETPRIVDMCCGSGSIVAEVLKAAKHRFSLTDPHELQEVVTGFDIDPLAVSLAKTTWVVTLAEEIKAATGPIAIPIYHADSLFAVTPGLGAIPLLGKNDPIPVSLDGTTILLPPALVQPIYRDLFDRIVDWAYDEALDAHAKGREKSISLKDAEKFLLGAASATNTELPDDLKGPLSEAVRAIATRMIGLALSNRNGIWAFILRNTFRPGLLSGQFNGLVSNPPWLALSAMGDNPYKEALTARADLYGVRPGGQSFLHLELGTTHLLHATDRYLRPGSAVACLVPGTIFNGHHHEPLRRRAFYSSKRVVALEITEVWRVAPGTFKYPGAAIIGKKLKSVSSVKDQQIDGFVALPNGLEAANFSVCKLGTERTAWVLEKGGLPIAAEGMPELPQQGADLMPRTAVCIEILTKKGTEYRIDTPDADSQWGFTIKSAKELKTARFPGHVAPKFVYRIAQSENLLPFLLGEHCAPIAVPALRTKAGDWKILDEADIRSQGFIETARRFRAINAKLTKVGQGKNLQERVDERGKLSKQNFGTKGHVLLAGAGGKHICAACVSVADAHDLIIDQTLYWKVIDRPDEAWFYVGVLNSRAMTEAIMPFNPKGAFGERHIHSLPYRLMPAFDPANDDHLSIAALARTASKLVAKMVAVDDRIGDPSRALTSRRSKIRDRLFAEKPFQEMEQLCAAALGTTAFLESTSVN